MTLTPTLSRETERAKEPAKAWRNKWRAKFDVIHVDTSERLPRGHEHWDDDSWPTREIAEQKAADEMADPAFSVVWHYVGAFPVSAP